MYIIILLLLIALTPLLVRIFRYIIDRKEYEESNYKNQTGYTYDAVVHDKGLYGEYLLYRSLSFLELEGSRFLFNMVIQNSTNKEKSSEVDLIMIDKAGVFVFENKNYSGWIFGSDNQTYWTQTLNAGYGESQKEKFFNPILQNDLHIKHLSAILPPDIRLYSLVTFSDRCDFKNLTINRSDVLVLHRDQVQIAFSNIRDRAQPYYSNETIDSVYEILCHHRNNMISSQEHAARMEDAYSSTTVCPWCGGNLVLRNGRYGSFYGCSNYPSCRYTKKID